MDKNDTYAIGIAAVGLTHDSETRGYPCIDSTKIGVDCVKVLVGRARAPALSMSAAQAYCRLYRSLILQITVIMVGLSLSFVPGVAQASPLLFNFKGNNNIFQFALDSHPTPVEFDDSRSGFEVALEYGVDGFYSDPINAFFQISHSGLFITTRDKIVVDTDIEDVSLFTGTTKNPMFSPQTVYLNDAGLVLTISSVPLPASVPMFGAALIGLACFGYAAKRRKAAAA